jgi:hypothetical protein
MKNKLLLIAMGFALTIQTLMTQVPSYVPTNGLVGYWPFNGNANDESGNGNNGTNNGAALTTDRFGNSNTAFYFSSSGCSTYIDAQINTTSINGALTISFWVNRIDSGCISPRIMKFFAPSDGPGTHVFGWPNYSNNPSTAFVTSTIESPFYQYNNISNNIWSHIVFTNDGSIAKLYQDGVLLSSNITTGAVTLAGNANFGRMVNPAYDAFNGKIDDIGIWNRALTQQEITNLFSSVSSNECLTMTINTGVLSTNPVTYNSTVNIYPNPANDQITIDCGDLANVLGWNIKITNMLGQEVFNQPMNTQQYVVPLNSWTGQGMYFVKIINAQNEVVNIKKIILQ